MALGTKDVSIRTFNTKSFNTNSSVSKDSVIIMVNDKKEELESTNACVLTDTLFVHVAPGVHSAATELVHEKTIDDKVTNPNKFNESESSSDGLQTQQSRSGLC